MPERLDNEYEVRITVYRNGRKLTHSDAKSSAPSFALYSAQNDLTRDLDDYEIARPKEFPRG